jgi:carotenoid cleavage dioxygenase
MSYVDGVHRGVAEERVLDDLPVTGDWPDGLAGTFARNSADPAHPPPGRYHWFDGDGMVHAIRLGSGRASYRNRWTRTAAFQAERQAGRALWGGILNPVHPEGGAPIKDTANTHLVGYRGRLLATWWLSGRPLELSDDLETLGPPPFVEQLGARTVAAHPKVDPRTGELVFFGFRMDRPPFGWVGVADREGRLVRVEDVDTLGPRIPHDIGLTERFVVLLDLPLGWDLAALRQGKRRIGFDRSAPARIGLWPRTGGPVRWFDVPPCYVYHLTSSYEDGDAVVVTGCRIDDPLPDTPDVTGRVARLDTIELVPVATRWRLDLASGSAAVETLCDVPTEFPRVNDATWGRPARFAYHPRVAPAPVVEFDGFLKLDHQRGTTLACEYPPGWRGGEVVFAARPGATDEDDGWVLTVLTHPDEPRSRLWVVPAQDVGRGPIATVELPRVPLGFHAEWLRADPG